MNTKGLSLAIGAIAAATLLGCGPGDPNLAGGTAAHDARLVGAWDTKRPDGQKMGFVFKADGTGNYTVQDKDAQLLTWHASNGTLYVSGLTDEGKPEPTVNTSTYKLTPDGSKLTTDQDIKFNPMGTYTRPGGG